MFEKLFPGFTQKKMKQPLCIVETVRDSDIFKTTNKFCVELLTASNDYVSSFDYTVFLLRVDQCNFRR